MTESSKAAIAEGLREADEEISDLDPSGPFCAHWIPGGCAIPCSCGHPCDLHWVEGRGCGECECDAYSQRAWLAEYMEAR